MVGGAPLPARAILPALLRHGRDGRKSETAAFFAAAGGTFVAAAARMTDSRPAAIYLHGSPAESDDSARFFH
jgi:hypothetical protein